MIDKARYWDERWLTQNRRIATHPDAAHLIASRYDNFREGRRFAVCAASFNTPLWQEAVMDSYGVKSI